MGTHEYTWVLMGSQWVLTGSQWVLRLCIFGFSGGSQAGTPPLLLPMGGIEHVAIGALLGADGGHWHGPAVFGPACFGRSSGWHDLAAAVLDLGSERVGARSSAAVGARSWW